MNIKDIQAPEWANKEHTAINCKVKFAEFDEFLPFTACQNDNEEHGRRIYSELESGKYGPVTPFVVTDKMVDNSRNQKLAEISNWRDAQENANIIFELDGHRWDGGKASQERLAPVVAVAGSGGLPEGFFWTDADNHDIPVNAAFLKQLEAAMVQAVVIQGFKIHERQRQMKEKVVMLKSLDEIAQYRVGWPEGDG
ncbi:MULTISPECIES: DUF4376 domain-containing protein [Citrobacter]|jgi:hypothetical protein|uniref:DUF4376 domain-containing protein n=1 Tax=Citrobacter gillenii TaxID=67828 RepID=A0ABD6ME44_9ENTR|nr:MULTISPECIES: DUF4376 domain-containing protein [Citrobacter]MBA7729775.1 DUF4376 domain-containing protein [Citrobacter freundii]MBA8198220.1 DUF4376 domain-containing protein [Citrobacter freundii]MBD0829356.1 DUF4376 domain-containing protein [Citrobacter sp. C1]MCS3462642.1 hypothetical protein [Citrobacter sp. JUb117]NTZ51311.1 DUF4376 domain-containing protein [Citrobacter gillenii]